MPKKPNPPPTASPVAPNRATRVGAGKAHLPPTGDPHSWWGRRYAEVVTHYLDDLGGAEIASQAQVDMARRAAGHVVQLEAMEADLSAGEDVDVDLYTRLTGTLSRVLERLGSKALKRADRPKAANPVLDVFSRPPEP